MLRTTVVLFLLAAFLAAQTPDSATIRGQILDQSHAAIPAVEINVKNALTALERLTQAHGARRAARPLAAQAVPWRDLP